jgi:hypothetical protein
MSVLSATHGDMAASPRERHGGAVGRACVSFRQHRTCRPYWLGQQWPSRPGEFHPEPLTDPDLTLSRHPARATARRLPPSIEYRVPPVAGCPDLKDDDPPPSLHGHYPASALLRGSPPLSGASVLSASRLEPLVGLCLSRSFGTPAHVLHQFLCSIRKPFLRPDPRFAHVVARRSCQGWPSHQPSGMLRPCQAIP